MRSDDGLERPRAQRLETRKGEGSSLAVTHPPRDGSRRLDHPTLTLSACGSLRSPSLKPSPTGRGVPFRHSGRSGAQTRNRVAPERSGGDGSATGVRDRAALSRAAPRSELRSAGG